MFAHDSGAPFFVFFLACIIFFYILADGNCASLVRTIKAVVHVINVTLVAHAFFFLP